MRDRDHPHRLAIRFAERDGAASMDESRFDKTAQRVSDLLSRRRTLGTLATLGLGAGLLFDDAGAKKKKKKKNKGKGTSSTTTTVPPQRQCTNCALCERCVDGSCQPLADGEACGTGGVCFEGACAKRCTTFNDCASPNHSISCQTPLGTTLPQICTLPDSAPCNAATCGTTAQCPSGEICGIVGCGTPEGPVGAGRRCMPIQEL